MENFHDAVPKHLHRYAHPQTLDHGYEGPVDLSLPKEWEFETKLVLDAAVELKESLDQLINEFKSNAFI